jgi:hypothetical protein
MLGCTTCQRHGKGGQSGGRKGRWGEKSNRISSPHPVDRESGRKTTLITEEGSRGGSRLVKSGLISPSTRGSNHPQSCGGRQRGGGSEMGWTGGSNQGLRIAAHAHHLSCSFCRSREAGRKVNPLVTRTDMPTPVPGSQEHGLMHCTYSQA